jgi:hypothetical protein
MYTAFTSIFIIHFYEWSDYGELICPMVQLFLSVHHSSSKPKYILTATSIAFIMFSLFLKFSSFQKNTSWLNLVPRLFPLRSEERRGKSLGMRLFVALMPNLALYLKAASA